MKRRIISRFLKSQQDGFTVVEIAVAAVIFSIVVLALTNGYNAIRQSYSLSRQLNEIYTVLSACPEIDRALDYTALSSTSNCYPNNSFPVEDGGTGTITYSPTLTVTNTSSLPNTDPLYNIADSKIVDISVGFQKPYTSYPALELKLLITRNGVGQT